MTHSEKELHKKSVAEHNHDHEGHHHEHGNLPLILYGIAVILAITALFLHKQTWQPLLFGIATLSAGYHVVIEEGFWPTIQRLVHKGQFKPDSHVLMGLAAIGAMILGEYWEGTLLILIFGGAHFLEGYAEGKSKRDISRLIDMNPKSARRLLAEDEVEIVEVSELEIGDTIQVLNGDQIPIDGKILEGQTVIDESAINGESTPQEKGPGDMVFGSTINGSNTFTFEVTKSSEDTVFGRIMTLVEDNQNNQTKTTTIIDKYEPKYVTFVILLVVAYMILAPLVSSLTVAQSFYRGLLILVSASPCALAAATISATLSATSNLARKGVLSRGAAYIQALADIEAIAFDKTGTLTKGQPEVTDTYFVSESAKQQLIPVLVAMEKQANHPLAAAIVAHYSEVATNEKLSIENQTGQGIQTVYQGKTYRVGKPTSFSHVPAAIQSRTETWEASGHTVVYMGVAEEVQGVIALMDVPKKEALEAIQYFKEQGLTTHLITGDAELTGQAVGEQLGIDHVEANVLPEDKSKRIAAIQEQGNRVAFVGDGVNDAPALVKANVGVAMGDGTDVALEVSDLALMKNHLSRLVYAHKKAKKMKRIILENIIFSLVVVAFLVFSALTGYSNMTVSVIMHEGSTLLVILNGLRLLMN